MPRVDFYILSSSAPLDRLRLVCRLADKAYHLGQRVYIQAASPEQAQQLDDLLWTFTSASFLPHGIVPQAAPEDHPILIGHDAEPQGIEDLLINLSPQVPPFFNRFERVMELVEGSEAGRQLGREHYRFYRDQGCALESHTLGQIT
jgi:DNA polymerase-3 subunit chi